MELFAKNNSSPLTLAEYLKLLPTHRIYDRFLKKVQRDRTIVSASRLNNLARELSEKQNVCGRFAVLSPAAQKACAAVYLSGDTGLASNGENSVFTELADSLLAYPASDGTGALFMVRFSEFVPHLEDVLVKKIDESCGAIIKTTLPAPWPWRCVSDVVMLLSAAGGGWLVQTKNGTFKKTTTQKLQRTMQCFEDSVAPFSHEKVSLQCMYALFMFCKDKRLIIGREQILTVNEPAIAQWLAQPLHDCYNDILLYFRNYGPFWDTDLVCFWQKNFPRRAWNPEKLFKEASLWHLPVFMLAYMGFLVCQKNAGAPAVAPSALVPQLLDRHYNSPSSDALVVSGDFSAIFPQESRPLMLYNFAKIGSVNSFDRVYHGRLLKENVANALVAGVKNETLLALLDQFHTPHNVRETVKEWLREFGRLCIGCGNFVLSSEECVSAQIAHVASLKDCLEPLRAHRMFLIKPGSEAHVRDVFTQLGFDWRMPALSCAGQAPAAAENAPDESENDTGSAGDFFSAKKELTPLVDGYEEPAAQNGPKTPEQKNGKYGETLKPLERSDLIHVLDYALIMGYTVTVEYGGSLGIKNGTYRVVPVLLTKGPLACFEGRSESGNGKKKFILEKIKRIGVRGQ